MAEMKTHWKRLQNNDYLGSWAFQPGEEKILTIRSVKMELVTGPDGKKEQCTVIHFQEPGVKPLICNRTNAKVITKLAGSPYIEDWTGQQIQLYVAQVMAYGEKVDGLRIRPSKPKQKQKLICEECKKEVRPAFNKSAEGLAAYTKEKYGAVLCADCATKRAGAAE